MKFFGCSRKACDQEQHSQQSDRAATLLMESPVENLLENLVGPRLTASSTSTNGDATSASTKSNVSYPMTARAARQEEHDDRDIGWPQLVRRWQAAAAS